MPDAAELTGEQIGLVAERFKVLAEPARLMLLESLRGGERTVTELMAATGLGQANASRHLSLLCQHGFVTRRKDGLFAYYALSDTAVFRLCDIMCARLEAETEHRARVLSR